MMNGSGFLTLAGILLLAVIVGYLIRWAFHGASADRPATQEAADTAKRDFLTGLPNGMLLNDLISQAMAVAERRKAKIAVVFVNLDEFKYINDSFGRPIGDKLLQSVATRLVACVRGADTVSQIGRASCRERV